MTTPIPKRAEHPEVIVARQKAQAKYDDVLARFPIANDLTGETLFAFLVSKNVTPRAAWLTCIDTQNHYSFSAMSQRYTKWAKARQPNSEEFQQAASIVKEVHSQEVKQRVQVMLTGDDIKGIVTRAKSTLTELLAPEEETIDPEKPEGAEANSDANAIGLRRLAVKNPVYFKEKIATARDVMKTYMHPQVLIESSVRKQATEVSARENKEVNAESKGLDEGVTVTGVEVNAHDETAKPATGEATSALTVTPTPANATLDEGVKSA